MILTKKMLEQWEESMRVSLTEVQKTAILDQFGVEPEPYEWSEQDIAVQIQNFLGCGEFVKSIQDNSDGHPTLPLGVAF